MNQGDSTPQKSANSTMLKPKRRRKIRCVRGGTLLLLSVLMVGSAVVRFGVEAAPAIGRELANSQATEADANAENTSSQDRQNRLDMSRATTPEDLRPMLAAFQQREAALILRERRIEDRMTALTVVEEAVDRKLKALVEAEEKLKETLSLADGAAEGDLTRLTEVYEKMKPKESAALFEEMDPQFAAGFLSRMRPEVAAGILAGMTPQSAYTISVVLAGRNATVPRN